MSFGTIILCIIAIIVHGVVFGLFTRNLAEAKGVAVNSNYFWLGFFTGIVGLIYTVGLPLDMNMRNNDQDRLARRIADEIKKS